MDSIFSIIDAHDGSTVNNPLLTGAGESAGILRNPDKIFFAGIVGVPWQDLATPESLGDNNILQYLTSVQLAEENIAVDGAMVDRWQLILGDPGKALNSKHCQLTPDDPACGRAPSSPLDPLMIASIEERPAGLSNPITDDRIVSSSSVDPHANSINGHETNTTVAGSLYPDALALRDELQYACTFELETPKVDCLENDYSCDCGNEPF